MGAYTNICMCMYVMCECVHMSTSNEYFYCSHVACSALVFFLFIRCLFICYFLSIVRVFSLFYPTNEIINLCKGWHNIYTCTFPCPVSKFKVKHTYKHSHLVCICVQAFTFFVYKNPCS